MKYNSHKSSIFDLDANVVALMVYLLPWIINIVSSSLSSITWIIPLIVLLIEAKSDFVRFHSANALSFYIIHALLYVVSVVLGLTAIISSAISGFAIIGFLTAGVTGIVFIVIGILIAIVEIFLFIGKIISIIRAYGYQEVNIPIIHAITLFILKLKR